MNRPDALTRDIARKCADDVSAAIRRNMALVDGPAEKLAVSMSAAASAMGSATGSYLAYHDLQRAEPIYPAAAAKGLWRALEPMTLRAMTDIRERNGQGQGAKTILLNPFPLVDVTDADRQALYGGLISAGHPAEFADHMAYDMADDDGGLQMLARHRLAADASRQGEGLPQSVVSLIIAAREAFDTGMLPNDEQTALDKALEPFASSVSYANEPASHASDGGMA